MPHVRQKHFRPHLLRFHDKWKTQVKVGKWVICFTSSCHASARSSDLVRWSNLTLWKSFHDGKMGPTEGRHVGGEDILSGRRKWPRFGHLDWCQSYCFKSAVTLAVTQYKKVTVKTLLKLFMGHPVLFILESQAEWSLNNNNILLSLNLNVSHQKANMVTKWFVTLKVLQRCFACFI